MRIAPLIGCAALLLASPSLAVQAPGATAEERAQEAGLAAAMAAVAAGNHDAALARIEPVIAAQDKQYAAETRMIYCAGSMTETLSYMMMAAATKTGAIAIAPLRCDALFMKGYVLADGKRFPEARVWLERAVAMRPSHAHYLNELAFVLQQQRQWQESHDTFARASAAAALGDKERLVPEKGRALRGMAFALIEQGKWSEAEDLFKECLTLDPNDARAKNELRYIAENRPKAT